MTAIFYRCAETSTWQHLDEVHPDDVRDHLEAWHERAPMHGDLVRVGDDLHVWDAAQSALVLVPRDDTPWVDRWEGPDAAAREMLLACTGVDRRRVVLAACACARAVLAVIPEGPSRDAATTAIETAKAWAWDRATLDDVRAAAYAAASAAADAAYAAASSASSAASSASSSSAASSAASAAADAAASAAADAAYAAASAAADAAYAAAIRALAPLVRRWIPLSVLACALVGARDPLPIVEMAKPPAP